MDLFIECLSSLQAANFRRAIFFRRIFGGEFGEWRRLKGLSESDPLMPPSEFSP